MDEQNITTGTEEFVDTSAEDIAEVSDSDIDAAWDDDFAMNESEADQQEDEEEAEAAEEAGEETEAEDGAEKPEAGDDWWKSIKVLGEQKEVGSVEEAKALMQKGADYDRIRSERDALKAERNGSNEFEAFVKRLAEAGSTSVDDFMEQTLVRLATTEDKSLTRDKALEKVRAERQASKAEAERKAKIDTEIMDFAREHRDVNELPQEVWDEYNKGNGSLKDIYENHVVAKQAKADAEEARREIEKLRAELAAVKSNQKNAAKSTGSVKSSGRSVESLIDKYWND